jgi:omega-amidase
MKIAAAQISCSLGDIEANLSKIADFAKLAKESGAELVVFPEMADTGYAMPTIREKAMPWTEGAVPTLRRIAQELSLAVVCGVSERDGNAIYNSQVVVNRAGEILAKYRKTHLFAPEPVAEHLCFKPGECLTHFRLDPFPIGLSICYDLRFPEVYRGLATAYQTSVFIISSAWPFPRVEHFRTLCLARAIENQSYLVVANRVGTDNGVTFCGSSGIIDPSGRLLAGASSDREEIIAAELSEDVLERVRTAMPIFADRRPELYRQ